MARYGYQNICPDMKQSPANPKYWKIIEPIQYNLPPDLCELEGIEPGSPESIMQTPENLITDLYSVPSWLRWLVRTDRIFMEPGIVHDYGYESHFWSRGVTDLAFSRGLEERGVPRIKRRAMYRGVHIGGAKGYATGPGRTGERLAILDF